MYNNSNNNNNNHPKCCEKIEDAEVSKLLDKIDKLQKRAVREDEDDTCDRDHLGFKEKCETNTRPVTFYAHNRGEWEFPVDKDVSGCRGGEKSCVFRVEKVEEDTVTCRVLDIDDHKCKSTNSFFILKISDIAAVRCLEDCFVDICFR